MNKPVNCGCGGEAIIYINGARQAKIYCEKCGIESNVFATKYKAIEAWNKAMGAGRDKIVITKGYWRATYDGLYCSVCNYKCETTALPDVCPHCGTSMKYG